MSVGYLDLESAEPLPPADVVLAADVLYLSELTRSVASRVAEASARGSLVLLADSRATHRRALTEELSAAHGHAAAFEARTLAPSLAGLCDDADGVSILRLAPPPPAQARRQPTPRRAAAPPPPPARPSPRSPDASRPSPPPPPPPPRWRPRAPPSAPSPPPEAPPCAPPPRARAPRPRAARASPTRALRRAAPPSRPRPPPPCSHACGRAARHPDTPGRTAPRTGACASSLAPTTRTERRGGAAASSRKCPWRRERPRAAV